MKIISWFVFLFIIGSFLLLSLISSSQESLTFDEIVHIQEGKAMLESHKNFVETNNPPLLRTLALSPEYLFSKITSTKFLGNNSQVERFVIISISIIGLCVFFFFARKLENTAFALVTLFFIACNPTYFAHSHYITHDIGATVFYFLSYMLFVEFIYTIDSINALLLAVSVALAFASKISTVPLIFLSFMTQFMLTTKHKVNFIRSLITTWKIITLPCITILVLWSTYFFQNELIIAKRDDPHRISQQLNSFAVSHGYQWIASFIDYFSNQPVVLGSFLASVKNAALRYKTDTSFYFDTQFVSRNTIFFTLFIFVVKTPLLLLFFSVVGLFLLVIHQKVKTALTLFIPVFFALCLPAVGPVSPQVRYMLPALPFLALLASYGIFSVVGRSRLYVLLVAVFLLVAEFIMSYPHEITYANQLLRSEKDKIRYLSDSNLDWGQGLISFADYIKKENPKHLSFSYFGRDDGSKYGLVSDQLWGSYLFDDICNFHEIPLQGSGEPIIAISITNWQLCSFYTLDSYALTRVKKIVSGSILIF